MTKKKTPERQQGSRKILDDSLTVQNVLEFADCLLDEWRPYLLTEGDMLLGRELSIDRAIIHQLQKAVATRSTTYDLVLKTLSETVKELDALRTENKQLKKGYQDLCKAWDENKLLHLELGTRQKKHVETCDKNFLKLKEQVENLMRRL